MSVDRLLANLMGRTMSAGRRGPEAYAAEVKLAKVLIETLGQYKQSNPEITDAIAVGAVRMVVKCIDESGGKIE
jgi:hypothetical protein